MLTIPSTTQKPTLPPPPPRTPKSLNPNGPNPSDTILLLRSSTPYCCASHRYRYVKSVTFLTLSPTSCPSYRSHPSSPSYPFLHRQHVASHAVRCADRAVVVVVVVSVVLLLLLLHVSSLKPAPSLGAASFSPWAPFPVHKPSPSSALSARSNRGEMTSQPLYGNDSICVVSRRPLVWSQPASTSWPGPHCPPLSPTDPHCPPLPPHWPPLAPTGPHRPRSPTGPGPGVCDRTAAEPIESLLNSNVGGFT